MASRAADPSNLPDSPYSAELREGVSRLHFGPVLEAEFRTLHLERMHMRTRVWSILTAVFAVAFTFMQVAEHGPTHPISLLHYVFAPMALLLAWLPWSRFYGSHYLVVAPVVLPLLALMTAPMSAQAVAEGRYEILIQLALQIAGTFEFTGLLYRMAVTTCAALVVGFIAGAILWALPGADAAKYVATLAMATFMGAIALRGAEKIARRQFLEGRLLGELLETDPLTGLKNRRSFDEHLHRTWLQAQRDGRTVSVLMIDVDEFKKYNDLYGHPAGDAALRQVAGVLQEFGRRPLDLSARYGGEEFAVVLHDVTTKQANELAEHLRARVESLGIPHDAASAVPRVTLSIGVAVVRPMIDRRAAGLVKLADEALYAAKAAGRNQVVSRTPEDYLATETGSHPAVWRRRQPRRA
jgi:diguanylate cyclase (GGDEF)-like protein